MKRFLLLLLSALFFATAFSVVAAESVAAVIAKKGVTYSWNDGQTAALTEDLMFPDSVQIFTNATFTVADGPDRVLKPGQILRRDGWLVGADGSVQPVVDHVVVKEGRVYVVRDGQASQLTAPMNFPNGMTINPDRTGGGLPGGRLRLLDGEVFRLNGTAIQAKDTVTLRNGQVVVQKDASLITLGSAQMMGMSDGTRVFGRGAIQKPDGTVIELREGQTVLVDGAFYGR